MLKYLFEVQYNDDTTYKQNPQDVSVKDSKRSCFFDVDLGKVKKFMLKGAGHTFAVDLTDGHFEVDGVPFKFHEEENLKNFRLIFFRKHTHHFTLDYTEKSHEITYRIGWQANDNLGRNIQRVMEIN